ncbi:MAG: hypothetical protein PVS2B1_01810 [Candidatus Dormibacteraceae bacterium]
MRSMAREETRRRIIDAFLAVVGKNGLERATTRAVAAEAGVNEVTLFRHFGDKPTLTTEAIRHLLQRPAPPRARRRAVAGGPGFQRLFELMRQNRDTLNQRDVVQLGIVETFNDPKLNELIKSGPLYVMGRYRAALEEAGSELRADVDRGASALALQGLVFMTVIWRQRGFVDWGERRWDSVLEAAARAYFKGARR